jgi:hypothetical protein
LHVFDQIVFKNIDISKQKRHFDVNLVFTATLTCTKRAFFITKKGTFGPLFKEIWGGGHVPPGSYASGCLDQTKDTLVIYGRVYTISLGPVHEFVCVSFSTGNLNCFRVK